MSSGPPAQSRWYNSYIKALRLRSGKSREVKRKHGVSLREALEIFDQVYIVDQKSDYPEQFRAIASRGEDVSAYFTNKFTVVRPVHRVNVDLTQGMLRELDERAARLNISRQAVIKTLLAWALNEEPLSKSRSKKKAG